MPSNNTGIMNNQNKDLIITINSAVDKLVRSIVISIGKLISIVILSSFLIIISMLNKYIAITVIVGYIIVYIYSKVVDFINRLPIKQFEENNQIEKSNKESDK